MKTCIVCDNPRIHNRPWCNNPSCINAVNAMTTDEINAIRQREALEQMRKPTGKPFVHLSPRE